jgi:hypothetical protein
VYYLFQEQLLSTADVPVRELLVDGRERLVPLSTNDVVTSCVVVAALTDGWAIRRVGSANLARSITTARHADSTSSGRQLSRYFIVNVPHMYRVYLGYEDDDELIPVEFHHRASMELAFRPDTVIRLSGRRSADTVFQELAGEARSFSGALGGPRGA